MITTNKWCDRIGRESRSEKCVQKQNENKRCSSGAESRNKRVYAVSLFEPFVRKWCASFAQKAVGKFFVSFPSLHFVRFQKETVVAADCYANESYMSGSLSHGISLNHFSFGLFFLRFVCNLCRKGEYRWVALFLRARRIICAFRRRHHTPTKNKKCKMRANLRRIGEANAINRKQNWNFVNYLARIDWISFNWMCSITLWICIQSNRNGSASLI